MKKINKKLYISNLAWNKIDNDKVLQIIKNNNLDGIDFAPLKISNNWKDIEKKTHKFYSKLRKRNLKINAIQGIFYKKKFNLFNPKKNQIKKIYNHINLIIKLSKILNCSKIIMGSSEFRDNKNLDKKKSDEIFCKFFKKIDPILNKKKIYICIETIPKKYNEKFLFNFNHLVNLINKINSKWIKINYDTSLFHYKKLDIKLFKKYLNLVNNIQITNKGFNHLKSLNKKNIIFCKYLKKNRAIKKVSLEIIDKNTNLNLLDKSIKNFKKLLN